MNMKALGIVALVGILAVGLSAGAVVAASPNASSLGQATGSHGGMGAGGMMNGNGPNGICTMDQTRTMDRTCAMDQVRSMNQTCDGEALVSLGPSGSGAGQTGAGPGYTNCPYHPGGNCTCLKA